MQFLRFLLIVSSLLGLAGCLTYQSSWEQGANLQSTKSIEGRWKGTWLSDANGHTGDLRAVASHIEGTLYRFEIGATFWKILRASYDVNFTITPDGENHILAGEQNLSGLMGGLYTYAGRIEEGDFIVKYKSKWDHGTFRMRKAD
jgi:hypothetical protein